MGIISWIEASVEANWKSLNDGAVRVACKLPEVSVILVDGESISLSEAKSQFRQLLALNIVDFLKNLQLRLLRKWQLSTRSLVT